MNFVHFVFNMGTYIMNKNYFHFSDEWVIKRLKVL